VEEEEMDIRRSKNIMGTREEEECSRRTVAEGRVPHNGHPLVEGEAGMISEWVVKVEDMAHPGGQAEEVCQTRKTIYTLPIQDGSMIALV
jgi:hypothetical protein